MMWRILLAFFLVVGCAAEDYMADARFAHQHGEFTEAARIFRHFADQGDAWAQFYLGSMYAKGQGVLQDDQETVQCGTAKPPSRDRHRGRAV